MTAEPSDDDVLATAAACGAMALTGRADGPPLTVPPGIVRWAESTATTISSHLPGTPVDGPRLLTQRAALAGLGRRAPWTAGGAGRAVRCSDGWLAVSLARESDLGSVQAVVQRDDAGDPWQALDQWAANLTVDAAVSRTRLLEIPSSAVSHGAAAVQRDGVVAVQLPDTGLAPSPRARPVVVDLSSLWAGPLCAHLLGLSGHRVIKVESPNRRDGARSGPAPFYDALHAGHETVEIDFTTRDGHRRLRELIGFADIVIEASRPRVLRDLGIDPARLLRPGGVWVSITAHGRDGPAGGWTGFGDDVAAGAGAWVLDPASGVPVPSLDAVADPLTGMAAAAAVLEARAAGGRWFLDAAMHHVTASAVGPAGTPHAVAADGSTGRWTVRLAGGGTVAVQSPRSPASATRAAPPGAHSAAVLAEVEGDGREQRP